MWQKFSNSKTSSVYIDWKYYFYSVVKGRFLVGHNVSDSGYSVLWIKGIVGYFPLLTLWTGLLWAAKIESAIWLPDRPREAGSLYWQINDSTWNQAYILSHRQDCSLRRSAVPLKHYAGCSTSISVTVTVGEREIGKSLYIVDKMPPSQFL